MHQGKYIHELPDWPKFKWKSDKLINKLGSVRQLQGEMLGRLKAIGFDMTDNATIETLSLEIVKSNAIEGEKLNRDDVRSSIARKLGAKWEPSSGKIDRNIDGYVEMMMDAYYKSQDPLTEERLLGWHASMFPTGYSGTEKIKVGQFRNTPGEDMVVQSANYSNPVIHFVAPKDDRVQGEMNTFLTWFNGDQDTEPFIKSGIAQLYFLTIHPFEDGNGRIARAISDMQLARSESSNFQYYSVSDQIERNRSQYYDILESTQKRGDLVITEWLTWYLLQVENALMQSKKLFAGTIKKAEFWLEHKNTVLNDRQRKMINKLFDGFKGKLTTTKWAKINKCSEDSALRDVSDLMKKGILSKGAAGGRSSHYYLTALGYHEKKDKGMSI